MKKERYTISLNGRSYTFQTSESEADMLRAARLVDEKTDETLALSPSVDTLTAITVTAYAFALDAVKAQDEAMRLRRQMQTLQQKLEAAQTGQYSFLSPEPHEGADEKKRKGKGHDQ